MADQGWARTIRELLSRLSPFERDVADRAVERLLREEEDPARQRQREAERERHRLINSGHDPREAARLARGGPPRAPWVRQGGDGRNLRRPRSREWG